MSVSEVVKICLILIFARLKLLVINRFMAVVVCKESISQILIQYVVVDTETIPSVGDSNGGAFPTGSFSFYVHDDLVESFKTTGQWTRYKTRIKPLSEFITAYPDDAEELGLV